MYYLKTLGELSLYEAESAAEPIITNAKPLMLLAVLATRPDRTASRDEIASLLWPHGDRTRSLRSLRQALFYVSSHVEEDLIESDNESRELRLVTERLTVDLWQFDRAIENEDYLRATRLYGGSFLSGLESKAGVEIDHWIESENARVRVGLEVAYSRRIEAALRAGDHERAVEHARSYVELNPLNDSAQATLVRTLRAVGDDVGALQAYRAYESLIDGELGVRPPEELRELMQRTRDDLLSSAAEDVATGEAAEPERVPSGQSGEATSAPDQEASGPAEGAEVQDRPQADSDARRRPRPRPSLALMVMMLAIVFAVVVVGMQASRILNSGPPGLMADVSANVIALARDPGGDRVLTLAVVGRRVEARPHSDLKPGDLISPAGELIAYRRAAVDGWNVAIRRSDGSEPPVALTSQGGDERPLAWSPDGRALLLATATDSEVGQRVSYELVVHELKTDVRRRLVGAIALEPPEAVWSPRGDEIVFGLREEGGSTIRMIGFDGEQLRDLTRDGDDCHAPAWSADGSELAFLCHAAPGVEIRVASADSGMGRQIRRRESASDIVWLAPGLLLVLTSPGGELLVVDARSGWERRLDQPDAGVVSLGAVVNNRAAYVEKLMIEAEFTTVSPGQWLRFPVSGVTANGDTFPAPGSLSWRVADSAVVAPRQEGWLRVVDLGRTRVSATLHGWRADSMELLSVPLLDVDSPLEIGETWLEGALRDRWLPFGQPRSTIEAEGAPDGSGVLLNNGDEHFESGVVSRASIPLKQGISVAVVGKAPFTGLSDQEFGFGLHVDPAVDSLALGRGRPLLEFRMRGPAPDVDGAAIITFSGGLASDTLPLPEDFGDWQRYVLQIEPDGAAQLVVDGRLYWRHLGLVRVDEAGEANVVLGFSSNQTDIAHGSVHALRGPVHALTRPRAP